MSAMFDVAFYGAHPDDIELTCGGTAAKLVALGYRVAVVDLTAGEMGSRGSVVDRKREAEKASAILGLTGRFNLGLPDCGLNPALEPQILEIIRSLRTLRAPIVFLPYWEERHPDHVAASRLVERATFLAGLKNFHPELGEPVSIKTLLYFQMRYEMRPSFIVDTSAFFARKLEAAKAFATQTTPQPGLPNVLIASELNLPALEARDRHLGAQIVVEYGEGFFSRSAVSISDPVEHFTKHNKPPIFFPAL